MRSTTYMTVSIVSAATLGGELRSFDIDSTGTGI